MSQTKLENAVRRLYITENLNCSETLLKACNEVYGLGLGEEAILLMGGFGGGMYTGNVCGALAGCTAALSKMIVQTKSHECENLPHAQRMLVRHFHTFLGQTQCARLKPIHHNKECGCLNTCLLAASAMAQTVEECQSRGWIQ